MLFLTNAVDISVFARKHGLQSGHKLGHPQVCKVHTSVSRVSTSTPRKRTYPTLYRRNQAVNFALWVIVPFLYQCLAMFWKRARGPGLGTRIHRSRWLKNDPGRFCRLGTVHEVTVSHFGATIRPAGSQRRKVSQSSA